MMTLHVRKPTPTALEYTVTTQSQNLAPSFIVIVLLKSVIVTLLVSLSLVKYNASLPLDDQWLLSTTNFPFEQVQYLRETVKWWWIVCAGAGVIWLAAKREYTEESLLVIRGLGIQTTTTSPSYLTASNSRFIPATSLQDIFIHEGFVGFEVKFYLAAVVKEEKKAVVIFPKLLPRREMLEEVWRGSRSCLYEHKAS